MRCLKRLRAPFPTFGLDRALHLLSGLRLGTEPSRSGASQLSAHGAGSQTTPFTAFRSGRRSAQKLGWGLKTYWGVYLLNSPKNLLSSYPRVLCMVKVVFIRGSIEVVNKGGKPYVRIYVYSSEGGKKLAQYVGKEVEGFVVIEDESP